MRLPRSPCCELCTRTARASATLRMRQHGQLTECRPPRPGSPSGGTRTIDSRNSTIGNLACFSSIAGNAPVGCLMSSARACKDGGRPERRFGMRVLISDSALAEETVTSWSTDRSAREMIAAICVAVSASCSIGDSLATVVK